MYINKKEAEGGAYKIYTNMIDQIKKVYSESRKYGFMPDLTEEELLLDTENYLQQIFNNIANAEGDVCTSEKKLIEKLDIFPEKEFVKADENTILESVSAMIPTYLKLAKLTDEKNMTKYANAFVTDIEDVFRIIENIDDSSGKAEYDFRSGIIENMKDYLKN